jgi:hypothetical protein
MATTKMTISTENATENSSVTSPILPPGQFVSVVGMLANNYFFIGFVSTLFRNDATGGLNALCIKS